MFDNGEEVSAKHLAVENYCRMFYVSDNQLTALMGDLDKAIRNGLGRDTNPTAVVKCYVTYVQDLPNRTEKGKFLALDLGGTNFRVLLIELAGEKDDHVESEIFKVPPHIQTGEGTALFDHIAECLAAFVRKHGMDGTTTLPLGFTFSFPLRQMGLTKGILSSWTKGFDCSGVVGEDVVALLKAAIARRRDVSIDVCGILNDTTGTLMSCAWKNENTRIGLIVGTGCNACYVEKVENAELFVNEAGDKPHIIINTEWGAFGDGGELDGVRTEHDLALDRESVNPGRQSFEKLISGLYLGEIVRLALVDMAGRKLLFEGKNVTALLTKGAFDTSLVSDVESDGTFEKSRATLVKLGITDPSEDDCTGLHAVCRSVSTRSAHMVAAGLAVLLNKMDQDTVTIGVDGSVYRFHPRFRDLLVKKARRLTKPGIHFDVLLSHDGSGRGAALVAAVAVRDA